MKVRYYIDQVCEYRFETLHEVKHHLSMYSSNDLLGCNGCYVLREINGELDETFARIIHVNKSGLKFHFAKP